MTSYIEFDKLTITGVIITIILVKSDLHSSGL